MLFRTFVAVAFVAAPLEAEVVTPGRCGVYALQVCLDAIHQDVSPLNVDDRFPQESVDHSLQELHDAARELGMTVFSVRWKSVPDIPYGEAPAILPVVNRKGRRHFVAALAA